VRKVWEGFKDVWNVLFLDALRGKNGYGGPWINLFDCGVFLGALSMLALLIGTILVVKAMFFWIF
jgi:hypothetical protein